MLSGKTLRADAITGTAVLRMVVSSDSMKNATATSRGNSFLADGVATGEAGSGTRATNIPFAAKLLSEAAHGVGEGDAVTGYATPELIRELRSLSPEFRNYNAGMAE